ncbi:MAG: oxidoreductase [Candidatus Binatia bacterium]|nr:MAG: oxidoreductase [Candidatus Binatia bacterium]
MTRSVFGVLGLFFFGWAATGVALAAGAATTEVVATVAGEKISRAELEEHVRPSLNEIENARYRVLREGLEELVGKKLLEVEARRRGVSVEDLLREEVEKKVSPPSDAEVRALYEENKESFGETPFETLEPRLADYLREERAERRKSEFLSELKKRHATELYLDPPRYPVSVAGRPWRGAETAPVTIVEFADYECPFCKRAEPTVRKVLSEYGDRVRFVYRHYPLPFHAHARAAARASLCAGEQGKFWEYHDALMAADELDPKLLEETARRLGLDEGKFRSCFASSKFEKVLEEDLAEAARLGVDGTPTFFVNGRVLDGAQPFERFQEVIEEELRLSKVRKVD